MACQDLELCEKIDNLTQTVSSFQLDFEGFHNDYSSNQLIQVDFFSLTLGFLAFFLFFIIALIFWNTFKKIIH